MNIKEVLASTESYFKKHDIPNPRLDAEVLLSDLLDMERIKLYVNYDYPLTKTELDQYRQRIKRRAQREPVAYITGHKEFMSLDLKVDQTVLVPRPETEILVENLIEICQEKGWDEPNIVDVGTGSGAIMVSLGYYIEGAKILGIDINRKALKTARANIEKFQMEDRLKVVPGNLLQPLLDRGKNNVNIVVSNPPYIDSSQLQDLPPEVQKEPRQALDGGKKGLEVFEEILPQASQILIKGGLLALEIGEEQAGDVSSLFEEKNWQDLKIEQDYAGRDRFVYAVKD